MREDKYNVILLNRRTDSHSQKNEEPLTQEAAVMLLEDHRRHLHDTGYDCHLLHYANSLGLHGYLCVYYDRPEMPTIELYIQEAQNE